MSSQSDSGDALARELEAALEDDNTHNRLEWLGVAIVLLSTPTCIHTVTTTKKSAPPRKSRNLMVCISLQHCTPHHLHDMHMDTECTHPGYYGGVCIACGAPKPAVNGPTSVGFKYVLVLFSRRLCSSYAHNTIYPCRYIHAALELTSDEADRLRYEGVLTHI